MQNAPPLRPRTPHISQLYAYHRAIFYPVGALDSVFEPAPPVFAAILPIVNYIGSSIFAGPPMDPLHKPLVFANQTGYVSGLGGIMAGYMVHQPLNVPETTNGSQ